MYRRLFLFLLLLIVLLPGIVLADPAEDLTAGCIVKTIDNKRSVNAMRDGKYTTWWESTDRKDPWVMIESGEPMYGLYLCFNKTPESYVIQEQHENDWLTVAQGSDCPFSHAFFELNGQKAIRILSTAENRKAIGFYEIFVFGKGDLPDWVQRWQPPLEKADILFFVAHPDDELLFLGGAIPTYAAEKGKKVQVAYLTNPAKVRRSEALNGLWAAGVQNYPQFGPFADRFPESGKLSDSYALAGGKDKVLEWVTELFRKYHPLVVVTHAENGEYGHPQHKMAAAVSRECFELAADASSFPDSASQYGAWQVKKLYLHLYGEEENQTVFDWDQPLAAFNGKTGAQIASEAFALHVTQCGAIMKWRNNKRVTLTVEEFGAKMYPYDRFGLYSSTVGEDTAKDDFLEHID